MKKKLLVIAHNFWPENFPINTFIKSIGFKNYEVSVLTGKPNYPHGKIFKQYKWYSLDREVFSKNVTIYRVPIIPRGSGSSIMKILNYFSFIFCSIFFGTLIFNRKNFDHIFAYAPSPVIHCLVGIYFKIIKKVKLSIWLQDLWPLSLQLSGYSKKNLILKMIDKIIYLIYVHSDIIFVQSKYFFNILKKVVSEEKLYYLPNPVNICLIKKKLKIKTFDRRKFNISYFGNIGLVQEFDTIIQAAKKINNSNINFHFFGEGLQKNKIKDKILKNNLSEFFFMHDYVEYKYVSHLINISSALFLSLKKNKFLNFIVPSKLQLYMFCGKPIIAELDGEGKRLVKESNSGLIVNCGNVDSMVKNILFLYNMRNTKRIKRFGVNGKNFYKKNFDVKILTKNFLSKIK